MTNRLDLEELLTIGSTPRGTSAIEPPHLLRQQRSTDDFQSDVPVAGHNNLLSLPVIDRGDKPSAASQPANPHSAQVLDYVIWVKKEMSRQSENSQAKPTRDRINKMTRSDKLVRLMNLISSELSDDQLDRILASVEEIALE
jgi:hypothetical protein